VEAEVERALKVASTARAQRDGASSADDAHAAAVTALGAAGTDDLGLEDSSALDDVISMLEEDIGSSPAAEAILAVFKRIQECPSESLRSVLAQRAMLQLLQADPSSFASSKSTSASDQPMLWHGLLTSALPRRPVQNPPVTTVGGAASAAEARGLLSQVMKEQGVAAYQHGPKEGHVQSGLSALQQIQGQSVLKQQPQVVQNAPKPQDPELQRQKYISRGSSSSASGMLAANALSDSSSKFVSSGGVTTSVDSLVTVRTKGVASPHLNEGGASSNGGKSKKAPYPHVAEQLPVGPLSSSSSSAGPALAPTPPLSMESVPEMKAQIDLDEELPCHVTTLNIRNIPSSLSQVAIMKIWPSAGSYDLLYLPYNHRQRRSIGYAFINFLTHEALLEFRAKWHGQVLLPEEADCQPLEVGLASVQGLRANLVHMKKNKNIKSIRRLKHMPILVLPNGMIANFKEILQLVQVDGETEEAGSVEDAEHEESFD
jgi:hypothetical protein